MNLDPDAPVLLTTAANEFEAEAIVEELRAEGITARVFGTAARVLQWELGANDAIQVIIRRADLKRACEVLAAFQSPSVDIDWPDPEGEAPDQSDILASSRTILPRQNGQTVFVLLLLLASIFGSIVFWEPGTTRWFADLDPVGPAPTPQFVCGGVVGYREGGVGGIYVPTGPR